MFILYPQEPFNEIVAKMRSMGEMLVEYTYPLTPKADAEDIACFKLREVMVDGYELYIQYTKGDYGEYYLETVEILAKHTPFIPFVVVCKIAKAFLGDKHLSYVNFFADNRRRYCWTLARDKDDEPMPGPYRVEMETEEYEGFVYDVMPTGGIDIH